MRITAGTNSFIWASVSNGLGFNFKDPLRKGSNLGTSNIWSWQNARGYEWLGLTATDQIIRRTNLDNMFRSVGQVMHLLEDASQPQHVRNEQHLYPANNWFYNTFFWHSPIEEWGLKNQTNLNYGDGSMLNWPNAGFTKLEDFWDRHSYNGHEQALNDAETGGFNTLGLAEWCNGNFIGARHQYAEYYSANDIRYYPYPSLEDSTDFDTKRLHWHTAAHFTSLKNGLLVERLYLNKTGAGVAFNDHSVMTYLGAYFSTRFAAPGIEAVSTSIRDNEVLSNYHNIFIPKAVKYSAGLLDYYFRGTIATSLNEDPGSGQFIFGVTNTSSQAFSGGNFYLVSEDTNGLRNIVQTTPLAQPLPSQVSINLTYTGDLGKRMLVIYRGTIGVTNGTQALDPVDDGIALAVAIAPACEPLHYDFMNVIAIAPNPYIDYGFEGPGYPAQSFSSDWGDGKYWIIPGRGAASGLSGFALGYGYRKRTTTTYYNSGRVTVKTEENFPYYRNPCNLTGVGAAYDGSPQNSLDPSEDLRITGLPSDCDSISISSDSGNPNPAQYIPGYPWLAWHNFNDAWYEDAIPPVVTETNSRVYFHAGFDSNFGITGDGRFYELPIYEDVVLSERVEFNTQQAEDLLSNVPLTPGAMVNTREGPMLFSYLGTKAVIGANLVPPGATYDGFGNYVVPGLAANQLYGIEMGANENYTGYCFSDTPSFVSTLYLPGTRYPYYWFDGTTPRGFSGYDITTFTNTLIDDRLKAVDWYGGLNRYNGVARNFPDTDCFVSKTGSVTLSNGKPGQPVTAKIGMAHSNRLVIYPLKDGYVITADDYSDMMSVAIRSPTAWWFYSYNLSPSTSFCAAKSRIRIPPNPDSFTGADDVSCFSDIHGAIPNRFLMVEQAVDFGFTTGNYSAAGYVPVGESDYGPENVISPVTDWGILLFGDPSQTNP